MRGGKIKAGKMLLVLIIVIAIVVGGVGYLTISRPETPGTPTPGTGGMTVSGYVRDPSENPISGATVYLDGLSASTDSNGYYTFTVAKENREFELRVEKEDYRTKTLTISVSSEPVHFDVQTRRIPGGVGLTVSGYVKDNAGNPISKAAVYLGGLAGLSTTTDTDGYYDFEVDREERDFELTAVKGGYRTYTSTVHVSTEPVQQNVQMSPGQENTTFIVSVPSNTPDYSVIYMEWFNREGGYWSNINDMIEMTKVSANTWEAELVLTLTGYGADGENFYYRYSRDKWGYAAAEEFTPDAENAYRKVSVGENAGETVNDTITKWRWFPNPDDPPLPVPESSAQTAEIVLRVQGENFRRGIGLQDFWNGEIDNILIEPTLEALKADNANAVAVGAPVWAYSQIEPLPLITESPDFPLSDLETLLGKLREDGFKVLMFAQFGPYSDPPLDPYTVSHPQEWWDAWYTEVERASLYSADLAENYGVEMLVPFCGLQYAWTEGGLSASEAEGMFSELIDNLRQHYSGEIGIDMCLGLKPPEWQDALPLPSEIPAFEKYDFIDLGLVAALSAEQDPTQEELNATARTLFEEKIEPLYTEHNKPIVLRPAYSSYQGVLLDVEKFSEAETTIFFSYNPSVEFSGEEQAMAYEAIMNAVAEAEYVIGIYPFGYHVEEFPRAGVQDIRGKPAEQLIANWYSRFSEEGI